MVECWNFTGKCLTRLAWDMAKRVANNSSKVWVGQKSASIRAGTPGQRMPIRWASGWNCSVSRDMTERWCLGYFLQKTKNVWGCLIGKLFVWTCMYVEMYMFNNSIISVKDSDLLEMTSLKRLPSETRTEALLVKYVAYFGICQ